jgi:hypothetical protein
VRSSTRARGLRASAAAAPGSGLSTAERGDAHAVPIGRLRRNRLSTQAVARTVVAGTSRRT